MHRSCYGHAMVMHSSCKVCLTSRHTQNIFIFYSFQKLNLINKILYKKKCRLYIKVIYRSCIGHELVMIWSYNGHA